jgi:Na+/alanine symporter
MDPAGLAELLWRPTLVYLVLGVGVLVTLATFFVQLRRLPAALRATRGTSPGWGLLVAGSAGMGAISGTTLAVTMGGPGALVWMWITAVLGMAIHWAEVTLANDGGEDRRLYMTRHLGGLGRALAAVFAVGLVAAALTAGGLFQTQQGGALLHAVLGVSPIGAAVVLAVAAVPLVMVPAVRTRMLSVLVPAALVLYLLAACTLALEDPWAAGLALGDAVNAAFGLDAAGSGIAGGAVALALYHGVLRATFAGESGIGSAAVADMHGSRRSAAMLVPVITTGLLATATALVVTTGTSHDEPIAEAKLFPLERHESRGLRPSQQVGQTIVLPLDTALEDGKAYHMRLRANPRGHALATMRAEENDVLLAGWKVAEETDTVVFRSRDPALATQAAWDVRVPMTRETAELPDGTSFVKLKPADPEVMLKKLVARYELDSQPYVMLGDYTFTGRVGLANSPNSELGEHLAMFEPSDENAPFNPKLHEFFRAGYRGPYGDSESERPPWAFVARPDYEGAIGDIITLRLPADPRGEPLVRINRAGGVEAPPWDVLLEVDTLVIRNEADPTLDIRVPVRAELDGFRVRYESMHPQWNDFRRIEKMPGFTGPYAAVPDIDFDVEVRSDARLSQEHAGRRTLVPLHPHGEPMGPVDALPYHPHPAELIAAGMHGPFIAREGAQVVAARFGENGSWRSWALALAGFVLVVSTVGAWAEHGGRAAAHLLGPWARVPTRFAVILVASCGGLFTLGQVLGLADASIAIAVVPNLVGLTLCLPRLRDKRRDKQRDTQPAPEIDSVPPEKS